MNDRQWECCFRAFAFSGFRVRFGSCSSIPLPKMHGHVPLLRTKLPHSRIKLSAVLIQLIESNQNVARFASIGRTQDAGIVQLVDDSRRATVADAEPPLKQ